MPMIETILTALAASEAAVTASEIAAASEVAAAETAESLSVAAEAVERAAKNVQLKERLFEVPAVFQDIEKPFEPAGGLEHILQKEIDDAKLKLKEIRGWIKEVNPQYNPFRYDAYSVNCGSCALAVEQRLSGFNPKAVAIQENIAPKDHMMELVTGKKCEYMAPEAIEAKLREMGPGSHLLVGINRKGGLFSPASGHWFNAFFDGEKIFTLDGQSGEVFDWPHDYGRVSEWCALV